MWHRQHPLHATLALIIFGAALLSGCAAPSSPVAQEGSTTPATSGPSTGVEASPAATSSATTPAPSPSTAATAPSEATAPAESPAASPTSDGGTTPEPAGSRQIVYTRYDITQQRAELRRVGMDGADDRVMAAAPAGCDILGLAVAPGGNPIAYSVGGCPTPGLHLINADGSDDRVLLNQLTQVGTQAFSPDGARIAFTAYREAGSAPVPQSALMLIDVAAGEPQQITPWANFVGTPAWRNGTQLVYSRAAIGTPPANWTTYLIEAAPEAPSEPIQAGQLLAVSPDRTALLLAVETAPQAGSPDVRLAIQPLDGDEPRVLDEQASPLPRAEWAPDGETLAVADWNARAITLLDVPSGQRSPIVEVEPMNMVEVRLAWDLADKRLLYSTVGPDGASLHLFDVTSNTDQVITTLPSAATFLAVTAAGEAATAMRPLEQERLRSMLWALGFEA